MPVPKTLPPIERRVVGTLLEKVLATPQSYPLTLSALIAGCNQKNNRDPEMNLVEADVGRALEALLEKGLVVLVRAETARVDKWRTTARDVFALGSEKAMALFAELLLRGPQTLSELRRNSSRMRHELTEEDTRQILGDLAGRPEPLAVNIGRAPGGRAERWSHTLYAEDEMAKVREGAHPPGAHAADEPAAPGAARGAPTPAEGAHAHDLEGRLAGALAAIAALTARVEALERRAGVAGGNTRAL
jgi:hypothetical protein